MPRLADIAFSLGAIGIPFFLGQISAARQDAAFQAVEYVRASLVLASIEYQNLIPGGEPVHALQPSRWPGSGVTVNENPSDESLIFMSGFFDDGYELRLVRRDGTPLARWPARYSQHFPNPAHLVQAPATDWNVDIHGALIHPDGSVVFNYEYGGTVKMSRCGETLWTLEHPTHHSVEISERGGYWIPGRNHLQDPAADPYPPFTRLGSNAVFSDDLIMRVTDDGEIADWRSVARILYDNGLEPLLTATGSSFLPGDPADTELVHLNTIGELPRSMASAFPEFEAGDLVLSLREHNLVVVVDPDTWRVKWHQTGPWRRQHDPEFNADGTITVFNNNIYRMALDPLNRSSPDTPRVSNIVRIDPLTRRAEVAYGQREGQELLTVIRGKHEPTPGGGFLITEFEGGRVFEVDAEGQIVWEYINRYDDEQVLEITEARLYPPSHFSKQDWTCPEGIASR